MRPYRSRLGIELLEARDVPAGPGDAPPLPPAPPPSATAVWVDTVAELEAAVANLQSNQTVVIQPGVYQLNRPLFIGQAAPVQNITLRGATNDFNDVVIKGRGMDNTAVVHGISVYNAQDATIANVSVGEVYYHAVDLQGVQGAERVNLYHCRFFDAGEQIVKSNAGGGGADDCKLEYCLIEYTNGPSVIDHGGGTGYSGGLHAHETDRWQIRHNLFRNFHTADGVQHTYAPTVLMWNGSGETLVEGNTFIDCDRAVAFGLVDRAGGFDHQGGVVRNNFVYQRPGLFTAARRAGSDAQILVFDSPGTQVYHNTVLTNGNSILSLEARWATAGTAFDNNLADAPFRTRDGGTYSAAGNYLAATPAMFVNPAAGDLHLVDTSATRAAAIDRAVARPGAAADFDGDARPAGAAPDVGGDEFVAAPPANTPPTISAVPDVRIRSSGTTGPIGFTVGDAETPAGALVVTATSSDPTLVPSSGLVLGGSGADRTITVTPAGRRHGTAVITLTVTDANGATATTSFTVTVFKTSRIR